MFPSNSGVQAVASSQAVPGAVQTTKFYTAEGDVGVEATRRACAAPAEADGHRCSLVKSGCQQLADDSQVQRSHLWHRQQRLCGVAAVQQHRHRYSTVRRRCVPSGSECSAFAQRSHIHTTSVPPPAVPDHVCGDVMTDDEGVATSAQVRTDITRRLCILAMHASKSVKSSGHMLGRI